MGLFSKKRSAPSGGAGGLQYPDELAQTAAEQYGNARFAAALETYGTAIDKIHTMCVMAEPAGRIRRPGPQDQPILDGFVNSLGAARSMDPSLDVSGIARGTVSYLKQIAAEAGPEAPRYEAAIASIERAAS